MFMFRSNLNCIFHIIVMENIICYNNIDILKSFKNLPYEFNISNTTFYTKVSQSKMHTVLKSTLMFSIYTDRKLCFHFLYICYEI